MENTQVAVKLDVPLQRGETTIDAITLRKPHTGALRGVKLADLLQLDVVAVSTVLPRISDPILTIADVNNLDPADLTQLATEVAGFLLPKAAKA